MNEQEIHLNADEFLVHAREKVSTGKYESAEFHTTISGTVDGDGRLDAETRRELRARLLTVHKQAQATVERAAENRIREPGHEDWGVPENGGDDA